MNSRARVKSALNHSEPDRIPRDFGGMESSGITGAAYFNLIRDAGSDLMPRIYEPYQYVAYVDAEFKQKYSIDTFNLTPEPASWKCVDNPLGFKVLLPEKWHEEHDGGSTLVRGPDGTIIARRPAGGHYFEPAYFPLQNAETVQDIERARTLIQTCDWPFFADEPVEALARRAAAASARGECVVLNLCCHLLAAGQMLRGMENFMMDLVCAEDVVEALMSCLLEGYLARINRLAPKLKGMADIVLFNDDLGTQQGPMISPGSYRKLIKPYQSQLFKAAKTAFGAPLLFHSCGAVREFIPDLIECGVDALNPVQISARGMDAGELKRDFGSEITFWGGGVDTQHVLNRCSPAEVKDSVRKNIELLAPGGGFVFCQVHNIQPDVPLKNIYAMFEALDEYGVYS